MNSYSKVVGRMFLMGMQVQAYSPVEIYSTSVLQSTHQLAAEFLLVAAQVK